MKKIFVLFAILLIFMLALTGCFKKPIKPIEETTESGEIKEINFEEKGVSNRIKDMTNYLTGDIRLGIASITPNNESATASKYCNDYDHITRYNFNNDSEYIDKFLIIPKDETVSYDLYSVKLTDEGTVEPEFEIDLGIKEPIIFTYDDYESIMPQYGIKIEVNGLEHFIPLSFSGYDGSLALNGFESVIKDLTIYD